MIKLKYYLSLQYQVWKDEPRTFIPQTFDASFAYVQLIFKHEAIKEFQK